MKHRYHPVAGRELIEAARYYESCRAGLGDEFLDAVDAGIAAVLEAPDRASQLDAEYRRHRIDRFPYGLVYHRLTDDLIEFVAVMNLRREPDYWRERLR